MTSEYSQGEDRALNDCLGRLEIVRPQALPCTEQCVATVASPGYDVLLDNLLASLSANGGCPDALRVVFLVGECTACERVIARHRAVPVFCRPLAPLNSAVKSALYSVSRFIDAEKFLCIDADMLVLSSLEPLFSTLEACPDGSILVCRDGNDMRWRNLGYACRRLYRGEESGLPPFPEAVAREELYPLVVNDGLFVGGRAAMRALDRVIRSVPEFVPWTNDHHPRNQFVFNWALARLRCAVELNSTWNVQLHAQVVDMSRENGRPRATWKGRSVRVLHFNGHGRANQRTYADVGLIPKGSCS